MGMDSGVDTGVDSGVDIGSGIGMGTSMGKVLNWNLGRDSDMGLGRGMGTDSRRERKRLRLDAHKDSKKKGEKWLMQNNKEAGTCVESWCHLNTGILGLHSGVKDPKAAATKGLCRCVLIKWGCEWHIYL